MLTLLANLNRNIASRIYAAVPDSPETTPAPPYAIAQSVPGTVPTLPVPDQVSSNQAIPQPEPIHPIRTDQATRSRIANLVANQSTEPPLQMLEHLARGNRQIAAFAAVLSVQAEVDYFKHHQLPNSMRSENFERSRFVPTGLEDIEKDRHQSIASEGHYRILSDAKNTMLTTADTEQINHIPDRSKSEVVVHKVLTTFADDPGELAPVTPSHLANESNLQILKGDLIYQRSLLKMPWDIDVENTAIGQQSDTVRPPVSSRHPTTFSTHDAAEIASLVMSLNHLPPADFIKQLAIRSEPCATFFSFISHALLIKGSVIEAPTVRYPYVDDESLLAEKVESIGEPFLPTFLDGVEHHYQPFNTSNPTWRIITESGWQQGQDKQAVLNHVFLQAMQHLHASAPTTLDMPIYPLVAYELLANAIGVSVPPYLVAHEQRLLDTLTENGLRKEQRVQEIALQQQRALVDKEETAIKQQLLYADNDVANSDQFRLSASGYQHTLVDASVDIQLALPAGPANLELIDGMRNVLAQTHFKQEISARSHRGQSDNLCWMRSSWLSVFAMSSPEYLAEKLSAICDVPTHGAWDAPVLRAIAQEYHNDPIAFLQGLRLGSTEARLSSEAMSERSAHLGPNVLLTDLLGIASDQEARGRRTTPEGFLQRLQCEIATAFRPPIAMDRSFMREVEAMQRPGNFASSNLPVTLHRALGLPVLVIETGQSVSDGEEGEQINYSAQLRVAAPTGSRLAERAEELVQPSADPSSFIKTLLAQFNNLPVIWLEGDHYTVHLPEFQVEAIRLPVMQQNSTK